MPLIPIDWLGQHVQLPEDIDASQLAAALVKVGLEEEAIHPGAVTGPVVVGRVLTRVHGKGLGRELMEQSIAAIRRELPCRKLIVNAQKQALGFYEKLGFTVTSGEFLEEGVVHLAMEKVV